MMIPCSHSTILTSFYCMKSYKILHVNHVSYLGGAEIALLDFLTYADRERYQPMVLAPEGALTSAVRALDIPCVPIPDLPGLNRYTFPRFLSRLPRLIRKIRHEAPDILYANTNFASFYTGLLGKFLNIPTIGHIRDIEPPGRMGRRLVRLNTRLLAISEAVQQFLRQENVPQQQIACVYDGVDLQHYHPRTMTGRGAHARIILGIVGQIGRRKGHLVLLEAFHRLSQRYPRLELWIVGKEPQQSAEKYTEQLHRYIHAMELETSVTFLGFRSDIPALLEQLDILVLPSLQEPFGKIVIEAMAMEKPVVASEVGGVPEIVAHGKTGLLVPPQQVDPLYAALETLINTQTLRIQMGRAGRKRVEQLFSIHRTVERTEAVYEQILHKLR